MIKSVAIPCTSRLCLSSPVFSAARHKLHARFRSGSGVEDSSQLPLLTEGKVSPKKLRTKKDFGDLPKKLISGDGSVADTLPAWNGGLGVRIDELGNGYEKGASCQGTKSPEEITKRRRRKASEFSDNIKSTPQLKPNGETPKRRYRKKSLPSTHVHVEERTDLGLVGGGENANTDSGLVIRRQPRNQLAKEILENLSKFPHCILLTRVGQFYESYFDQAQEVSRLLSIKLTKRTWDDQRIWMCGFPLMHLDKHLKVLVQQHNRSVAMCEEFRKAPDSTADSKPSFERRVTRVITPGTLIDESFLNPYENNYLLAISVADKFGHSTEDLSIQKVGLAWIDVSTGEFFAQNTDFYSLKDHIARISPREIVIDKAIESLPAHPLRIYLQKTDHPVSYASASAYDVTTVLGDTEVADDIVDQSQTSISSDVFSAAETSAIALLNNFLRHSLLEHAPRVLHPAREGRRGRMQIDAHTLKALEIRESIREGGASGSLLNSIMRTVTNSGTRLLSRWLCSPSTSLDEINTRQTLVELFCGRPSLRNDLVAYLRSIEDASRISQKFLLGKGDVDDLHSIRHTIDIWKAVKGRIVLEKAFEIQESERQFRDGVWHGLDNLMGNLDDLDDLANRIELAIGPKEAQKKLPTVDQLGDEVQESEILPSSEATTKTLTLPNVETKWAIKPRFSAELAELHDRLDRLQIDKEGLQEKLQKQYDAPSLTLRHSSNYGMHVHVAKPRRDTARLEKSRRFVLVAENKTTKMFLNQEWLALGTAIIETAAAIYNAEKDAFSTLRNEINAKAITIRRNARIFDELDVTSAFASLAAEMNFVRPIITEGTTFHIENGRHPTVELGLLKTGRMFTGNSVNMSDSSRLHVITGPNMAGKSTFLRQTALIAILAQTGSFVPADSAEIGLVDKVFSRIGAKDDLFRDRSTFMVEMLESAEILNNATERSLVIMDEVGRGTTVKDGLAIAFATIHHLYFVNRCRALFATHFHELADMLGFSEKTLSSKVFPHLEFSCTDVKETEDGRFAYSHRMRPGVNRNSHGLKVAQLAGMPPLATRIADEVLSSINVHQAHAVGNLTNARLMKIGRQFSKI